MLIEYFILSLGLVLLYLGSEMLVRGSAFLALSLYIRPIIVGITVVAFATSAPELIVSLIAVTRGSSGVSVGNIIGSNIINIALVLGTSAAVTPLEVNRNVVKRELPFMIGATVLFWVLCLDGVIGKTDGGILLVGLGIFLAYGIMTAKSTRSVVKTYKTSAKSYILYALLILMGLICLAKGAEMIVNAAISIARTLGFSELFIGLSIVALGTSLPELMTSVVAVTKGEGDISIGNVLGSNLFNICMVIGTVGLLTPLSIDNRLNSFEFPVMLLLSVLLLFFIKKDYAIKRSQGLFLVFSFFLYIGITYFRNQM